MAIYRPPKEQKQQAPAVFTQPVNSPLASFTTSLPLSLLIKLLLVVGSIFSGRSGSCLLFHCVHVESVHVQQTASPTRKGRNL